MFMTDQLEVLLKEYEVMRTEVRLYINKYYLALTAILGIFTTGIFKSSPNETGFTFIWVPYIVAGILGFMTLVTFFINKTAGYVRYLESRINQLTITPIEDLSSSEKSSTPRGLLLWETFYADYGMERDSGKQFASLFTWALIAFVLAGVSMLALVINFGYQEAQKLKLSCMWITSGGLFLTTSITIVLFAVFSYWWVNTKVRQEVRKLNNKLLASQSVSLSSDVASNLAPEQ